MSPEAFTVEDCSFQEKQKLPTQTYGVLSDKEEQKIQKSFTPYYNEIHDNIGKNLGKFLSQEVRKADTITLLSDFGVEGNEAAEVVGKLGEYNVDIGPLIAEYHSYIINQLILPEGSTLGAYQMKQLVGNVRLCIGDKIGGLGDEMQSIASRYDHLTPHEAQGIVDDAVRSHLCEIKDTILPNAKLYLASTVLGFFDTSSEIFTCRALEGDGDYDHLGKQAEIMNRMFQERVAELGDTLTGSEGFESLPDLYMNIGEDLPESYGVQEGLGDISDVSLLPEEEAKRYKKVKTFGIACMLIQALSTGVTDGFSLGVDFFDIFNNTDQTFEALKLGNFIDSDIHIGKEYWERVVSVLSFAGGAIQADAGVKLTRAYRMMSDADIDIGDVADAVGDIMSKLGLNPETASKVQKGVAAFGRNRANQSFMERANRNGTLSDTVGTHKMNVGGQELSLSQREEAFLTRLQTLAQAGNMPATLEQLGPDNVRHLLKVINMMHQRHGEVGIGNHRFSQIADKIQIAKENGIPPKVAHMIIREGFAGTTPGRTIIGEIYDRFGYKPDILDSIKREPLPFSLEDTIKLHEKDIQDTIRNFLKVTKGDSIPPKIIWIDEGKKNFFVIKVNNNFFDPETEDVGTQITVSLRTRKGSVEDIEKTSSFSHVSETDKTEIIGDVGLFVSKKSLDKDSPETIHDFVLYHRYVKKSYRGEGIGNGLLGILRESLSSGSSGLKGSSRLIMNSSQIETLIWAKKEGFKPLSPHDEKIYDDILLGRNDESYHISDSNIYMRETGKKYGFIIDKRKVLDHLMNYDYIMTGSIERVTGSKEKDIFDYFSEGRVSDDLGDIFDDDLIKFVKRELDTSDVSSERILAIICDYYRNQGDLFMKSKLFDQILQSRSYDAMGDYPDTFFSARITFQTEI